MNMIISYTLSSFRLRSLAARSIPISLWRPMPRLYNLLISGCEVFGSRMFVATSCKTLSRSILMVAF